LTAAAVLLACGGGDSTGAGSTPGAGNYSITIRYIDATSPSSTVQASVSRAVARWEQIVRDSVGSVSLTLPAGTCDSTQPAINESVKDLLILVHTENIPDTVPGETILGEGGPCIIRNFNNLPVMGMLELNGPSAQTLANEGLLDVVFEHEIGHILGVGTIWDLDGLLQDSLTSTPWFSGPQAQAAFRAAQPNFIGNVVPVEGTGQVGTILAHWRESAMTNELMTGLIDPLPDPLSKITIASLADLGYTVNTAVADPWPTPTGSVQATMGNIALRLVPPSGRAVPQLQLRRPRFAVTRQGQLIRLPGNR
jgi:hypothetical protein